MSTRFSRIDALVLLLAIAAFVIAFKGFTGNGPYLYDEADYMNAGSHGFTANYLERPSLTIIDFVQAGLHRGMDAGKRKSLSEWVRSSGDITFLRHFHGPIYFYWISLVGPLVHFSEAAMRLSGFLFHLCAFVVIYVSLLFLVEKDARTAAVIASFLYLLSSPAIGTDGQITPHIPYVLFTVLTLVLFARFLQTGRTNWWYAAVASCALAFCSIEYAILLPITFACCLFVFRERVFGGRDKREIVRIALRSAALFFGIFLILWPIGLLELSAIKSYFYIGYLALLRKGSFGTEPFYMIWWHRVTASPVEYGLALVCGITAVVRWRKTGSIWLTLPCLIYAALMLITTLKNTSLNPTYVSSILPALAVVSGVVIASLLARVRPIVRYAVTAVLLIATAAVAFQQYQDQLRRNQDFSVTGALVQSVRASGESLTSIMVPYEYMPTMLYYFPKLKVHPILPTDDTATVLNSVHDDGYRELIYVGHDSDDVPRKLREQYHVESQAIGPAPAGLQMFRYRLT